MHRYRNAIGLVMGAQSAKFVEASRRGPFVTLVRSGRVRLPEQPAEARTILRNYIEKNGWNRHPCLVAVPSDALFLRRVETAGSSADLLSAVQTEMDAFHDMMSQGALQEYTTFGRRKGKLSALLAVARPDAVEKVLEQTETLGLNWVDAIPLPVALYNATLFLSDPGRDPLAAILVGRDATEFVSGNRRELLFSRRIPLGRTHLPENVGGLKVSSEDEKNEKNAPFDEWLTELQTCMTFAYERESSSKSKPTRLLLFGLKPAGFCVQRLEERLGIPVILPETLPRAAALEDSGRGAAAAGLALAGVGRSRIRLSLMPPLLQERIVLQRQRRHWAFAAAAGAAALLMLVADASTDRRHRRSVLEARQQDLRRLKNVREDLIRLQESNDLLQQTLTPLRESVASSRAVSRLLAILAAAKHSNDWITLVAAAPAYFPPNGNVVRIPEGPPQQTRSFQFVIEGYTPVEDLSTVREMIDAIRRQPRVTSADLLGDDRIRDDTVRGDRLIRPPLRRFAVEVSLWPL
ncbi:MAG: hypothetical protein U1E27_12615 [Kiritimatiellia bacterium]|nr:hypothetical protein [Kiritimatiellia bacterium]